MPRTLLLLALLALAGCGGQAASAGGGQGGQLGDEGNLLPPIVLGGAGDTETYAFHLAHANFKVTWQVTPPGSAGCTFGASLKTGDTLTPIVDGQKYEGASQQSGLKEVGELPDGQYTMVITTDCAWRMAVTAH
ncbi:MAG TPA: hypothetical protein VHU77_00465 [Candidatus Limnocylindria bacterium]|jgi:hypothetical protein|nr:hypothetical protein [Candidatus Limnocylindria bacterium]